MPWVSILINLGCFFLGPMMPGLFRKWSTFSKLAWKGSASVVGGLVAFRLPIDLLYFVVMLPLLGITMVGLALPSLPQLQLHGVALDGCSSATFVRLVPCS